MLAPVGPGEGPLASCAVTVEATLDVVGIGNALVDVLTHEDDAFLEAHGLVKGAMTLIDTDRAEELYSAMGAAIEMSGGSVGNSIAGARAVIDHVSFRLNTSGSLGGAVYTNIATTTVPISNSSFSPSVFMYHSRDF